VPTASTCPANLGLQPFVLDPFESESSTDDAFGAKSTDNIGGPIGSQILRFDPVQIVGPTDTHSACILRAIGLGTIQSNVQDDVLGEPVATPDTPRVKTEWLMDCAVFSGLKIYGDADGLHQAIKIVPGAVKWTQRIFDAETGAETETAIGQWSSVRNEPTNRCF
jgi:hypothetical protein